MRNKIGQVSEGIEPFMEQPYKRQVQNENCWYVHAGELNDEKHIGYYESIDDALAEAKTQLLAGNVVIIETRKQWLDRPEPRYDVFETRKLWGKE